MLLFRGHESSRGRGGDQGRKSTTQGALRLREAMDIPHVPSCTSQVETGVYRPSEMDFHLEANTINLLCMLSAVVVDQWPFLQTTA
jgi:hypothetical protein